MSGLSKLTISGLGGSRSGLGRFQDIVGYSVYFYDDSLIPQESLFLRKSR